MPTLNQLVKKPRRKRRQRLDRVLQGSPQREGVITSVFVLNPKKPNSGNRKACRVRFSNGVSATVFIPGEGHNLQEHSKVLVARGPIPDLSGVGHRVVRGTRDCLGVERSTSRSRYGWKKNVVTPTKKGAK